MCKKKGPLDKRCLNPWRSARQQHAAAVSLSLHIHPNNRRRRFSNKACARPSGGAPKKKGQDALHILGGRVFSFFSLFLFENKHVVVPKPFHILKGRQSTNLWIGRPGTPVTNVISPWHRGFKPIQPPTHRPPLRLCHYNPQAGFLLPRWAGDSMCEQNSAARAAGRNYYLFPSMTIDVWTVRVLSHCMNTFEVLGDWTAQVLKKKQTHTQGCEVVVFIYLILSFSFYYPVRLYLQWETNVFYLAGW